jgi:2-oxoisovalerate dehydrogenase E1 component
MCGLGGEVAATIMEHAFDELDAPMGRLHTEAVTHPFSPSFDEATLLTVDKIIAGARGVVAGCAPVQKRPWPALASSVGSPTRDAASLPSAPHVVNDAPAKRDDVAEPTAARETLTGVPITMPHGDLTVTEGRIIAWLKNIGESVQPGDPVVEIETDKGISEVEAPIAGRLVEIIESVGAVVAHGTWLGIVQP